MFETDGAKQNAASMTNADGSIKFETVFSSPNLYYEDMVLAVTSCSRWGRFCRLRW